MAQAAVAVEDVQQSQPTVYDFDKYIGMTGAEILHQILLERDVKQVCMGRDICCSTEPLWSQVEEEKKRERKRG